MFFLPLILSAALDMSLPEFQPERDLSGNYIVSSEDGAVELDTVPDSIVTSSDQELEESLSLPAPEEDVVVNELLIKSSPALRSDSNSIVSSTQSGRWIAGNTLISSSSENWISYYYFEPGYDYYISSPSGLYFGNSISPGTSLSYQSFGTMPFTVETAVYGMQIAGSIQGYYEVQSSSGGDDITGNDMTAVVEGLSTLNGSVVSGNDQLAQALEDLTVTVEINNEDTNNKFRALIFIALISFLYPIALSIVHNIVGGDSNV